MKYLICILLLCFSLQAAELKEWLSDHLIPLKTVMAGQECDDLQPLKPLLNGVQVLALGEATHGTKEFFQIKHRLLEFLVKEMGYRIFLIEANYVKCLKINDYVLYGAGDRDEVLTNQGFWTWDTREVADMIEWMRAYNSQVPPEEKVQFLGMDMQTVDEAFGLIENYLTKVNFEKLPQTLELFQKIKDKNALRKITSTGIKQLRSDLLELIDFFSSRYQSNEAHSILFLFNLMVQQIEINAGLQAEGLPELTLFIEAHPELHESIMKDPASLSHSDNLAKYPELKTLFTKYPDLQNFLLSDFHDRDYYMAQNILSILREQKPGVGIVVWAHNGHIKKSNESMSMGTHLKEALGGGYYALGLTFAEGSFRAWSESIEAWGFKNFTLPPAPEGTFSYFLSQAGEDLFLLDFKSSVPLPNEIKRPLPFVSIGALFRNNGSWNDCLLPINAPEAFDGIVYIKRTQAALPNHP